MGDCLRRAFIAGLRWCGIDDNLPDMQTSIDAIDISAKYGLRYVGDGQQLKANNDPILVIYKDDKTGTDSIYHAVFASDFGTFVKWEIFSVVIGWPELRLRNDKLNTPCVFIDGERN